MSIQEKINQIKEDFSYFDNWEDKYQYLIDLGKKLPKLEDKFKNEDFRVQGCTSNLWVIPQLSEDKLTFIGASDSVIVQGLFYLVQYVYNNERPQTILDQPLDFFDEIGLSSHLGPSRSNGLNSLKKRIFSIAIELTKN
jgi:cysteine desulfuration protein SufE